MYCSGVSTLCSKASRYASIVLALHIQTGSLSKVPRILLQLRVNIPIGKTPTERFLEVAVFPLSLLRQVFARFRIGLFHRVPICWLLH